VTTRNVRDGSGPSPRTTLARPVWLPDEARLVIESDALAHVTTIDPDGRPQTTLAWVGLEGDEIVFATLPDQRKLRILRRDPRITISIQTERVTPYGLHEYLVIYGTARVTDGGGPEVLQRLAHTYLGPDVTFPPMPDPPPGFVTRVTVDRLGGVGPWNQPTG
jgi:PPOX class probable F420-dependent enzyme